MKNQTKVVTYNNVLNPLDRVIKTSGSYKNIDELLRDLKYDNTIYDLVISKNSVIMDGFFEIDDGDIINITIVPKGGGGGGKNILGLIAMVVVTIVSYGAATAFAGSAMAASMSATAVAMTQGAIMAGIMITGSLLINAIFPPQTPSLDLNKQDFKNSQTYGWGVATNHAKQAQVIPKIYGTHKITPPLIASYIQTNGDKQYFNGLYAINDGEIKSVSDIRINKDDIKNFKEVKYEVRNGTTTQKIIPSFNDTHYDKPVNKKLSANQSYSISETDGNAVSSLSVTLLMSRGLYYANDKGALDNYSISVSIEYSLDNKTWLSFTGMPTSISAASTSAFRKTYKMDNLYPAKYYIRARFNSTPATSSRYGSECVLEYITETTKDDFVYPNTALLAVRAMATDQLNGGAPIITCVVSANSDNPAYVCKQILKDSGVSEDRISSNFNEWAKFCDDKNLKCNIVFDSEMSVKKALDMVSTLGRASVVQMGSRFDVIVDKAELIPVQSFMFGMGNILKDSFKQTFLPLIDRANFLEITYYDKDKDYEPSIVSLMAHNYNKSRVSNKTSITLPGCTDEAQARAYGRFLLNCNRYLTQTVEFEADKDSLVCRYGDIIRVSHDVPEYGFSGRLVDVSSTGVITLDREIEFRDFTGYALQLKNDLNEVKEYLVLDIIAPNKIRVELNGESYKMYDNYAIGEINKISKLYRIIKISTSGEFTRHITALEYNEDVYNDSELISSQNSSSLSISNLRINESLRLEANKNIQTYLNLAWRGSALSYNVRLKEIKSGKVSTARVNDSFLEIAVKDGSEYEISISDSFGSRIDKTHKVVGKLSPPPPVTNLAMAEFLDEYELSWSYDDKPIDFKHYEIYKNGYLVDTTTNLSTKIKKDEELSYISVIAVDTSSIKSKQENITLKASPPKEVRGFSTIYKDNKLYGYWESSGKALGYEIRKGEDWELGYKVADTAQLTAGLNFNGTYLIKSYYENSYGLKIYSGLATRLVVDESRLDVNVMEYISHPAWDGGHNNTQVSNNGLCLLGKYEEADISKRKLSALNGIYDVKKVVRLSREKVCNINAFMDVSGLVLNSNFDTFKNIDLVENIDGANENDYIARLEISTSKDGVSWSEFKMFESGEYIAKEFKFRVVMSAKNELITPFINALNILVDMPDVIESESSTSSTTGEISIRYKNDFSIAPKVQITIINAKSGDDAVLTNQTNKGFSIKIIDKNGVSVKREFNYIAKGY